MTGTLRGLAFDIRRFSTRDGAGIRTTVFMKGCPLRCAWCQNPEGIASEPRLTHFARRCILCGLCLEVKDEATLLEDGRLMLNAKKAKRPALYEDICPAGALRVDSRWYTLAEMMAELIKDQAFFRHGGGVTLSGGEPFYQSAFAAALLRALKAEEIDTAVETSLFTDWRTIEAALPYLDTLFVDFKIADSEAHKRATGVGNERIQDNLARVLRSPYRGRVTVRTPLIPRYTASEENLTAICGQIASWYPDVRYELLNYNPLAKAKYDHVPHDYCFAENPPLYKKAEMDDFRQIARRAGVRHVLAEG